MHFRRLVLILFTFFVILPVTLIQLSAVASGQDLVAGRNVNMVDDDPYLQRQNEPSFDVSHLNPRHLLAGANDYSLVDFAGDDVDVTYDAWLGVFKSYDGGESWEHDLLPPYQGVLKGGAPDTSHPLYGFDAAADPTVRAGKDGWFYYSGIAFDRERNGSSVVFVMRFRDNGSTTYYVDTTIIDEGTSGQFQDKPWIGTDRDGRAFIIYSIFLGEIDNNIHSKIMISRTLDGGNTWLKPYKISEGEQKNQGTNIEIDLNNDIIYVAWRRFMSTNDTDAILIVKSEDHGATFTKAEEVASIPFPFDQPTLGSQFGASQFRTNSYPTITVDNSGRIYVAWAERISEMGDARIVITSLDGADWGSSWPAALPVETPFYISSMNAENPRIAGRVEIAGFQFMPTMIYSPAMDRILIAWFDTRFSARRYDEYGNPRSPQPPPSAWIRDDGSIWQYRETVDVRLAQADADGSLDFEDSIQVSRYLWVLEEDPDPEPGNYRLKQGQFSPPCYKMFGGGTTPFHGDYIDIAHSPDDPFTYYVTWTDNRDVRPPGDDGFWGDYTPPVPFDPDNPGDCDTDPNDVVVGMRNQNVYCSKITRGINIGTFQNNLAPGNTSFVIFVQNLLNPPALTDPYASEGFNLDILNPDIASFAPLSETPYTTSISANVPYYSTIARQVFVNGSAGDTIRVRVWNDIFDDVIRLRIVAGGFPGGTGSIVLNGTTMIDWDDPELIAQINPSITNPSITNPSITNANVLNPSITNPSITNPSITNPSITNPSITNPSITNPSITNPSITNPSITNPSITNPSITNSNIVNPSITNPSITNIPPGTRVADKVWSVHNEGSAVAAYTFKGIAGESLPTDGFIYTQLLIYKVHYTHSTNGCYLMTEAHHELLVNVINPILTTDTSGWTQGDINKFIGDPEVAYAGIENATFSLAPDEHAVLILRVIDTKTDRILADAPVRTLAETFTPAPINYEEAASVFVQHSSTEDNPTGTASLMVLPQNLPAGIKAGELFPTTTFSAIGGTIDPGSGYTWTHTWIEPFELSDWGLTIAGNTLSGISRWIGPISFTMVATDDAGNADSQTFMGVIEDPDPLGLVMTPIPDNLKEGDQFPIGEPLVTFTPSGGVPPYTWSFTDKPVSPTAWSSGLSLEPTGTPGEMGLYGTLQAGEWDITVKITDNRLPPDDSAFAQVTATLCVSPLPLEINLPDPAELAWSLGTEHTIQISVSNAKLSPFWAVSGLPSGIAPVNPAAPQLEISGKPQFDPNTDYPATYQVTVDVTDPFSWCGNLSRTESVEFDIIVNPKAPEWEAAEANSGVPTAVAADQNGNSYVTGYTGAEGSRDFVTVKYDAQGNREWSVNHVGPSGGDDAPRAIAVDETGAYVTGFSEGTTTGMDIYTVKYDPDGSKAWDFTYDGPSHLGDEANVIAQDAEYIYVAGFVHRGNKNAHKDMAVIKLRKDTGEMVWDARYDSTRNGMDEVTALAVDDAGNVYAAGKSQEGGNGPKSFDFLTLKFDSAGQLLWDVRDDGIAFGDDVPAAIAADAAGNICVTGWQNVGPNDTNFYTVKYDANGQGLWSSGQSFGGPGEDRAAGVGFDAVGNVYVTGTIIGTDGHSDYATVKYASATGNQEWADVIDNENGEDAPVGVAVIGENGEEFVYVAGFKATESNGKDYFGIKYKATGGSVVWIGQYNSASGVDDEATAMFVNETGLYLTGFTQAGFLTIKYDN